MRTRKLSKKKRSQKFLVQFLAVALAAMAALGVVLTLCASSFIRKTYEKSAEDTLRVSAQQLADELRAMYPTGDWAVNSNGYLVKGGVTFDVGMSLLDRLSRSTGLDYTITFGRQRMLTTLRDANDTLRNGGYVDDGVYTNVVTAGTEVFADEAFPDGVGVSSYFVPLKNPDGTTVGMISASSEGTLGGSISGSVLILALITAAFILCLAAVMMAMIVRASRQMGDIVSVLNGLSRGSLKNPVDRVTYARNDEIGEIAASAGRLDAKLERVIRTTKEVAGNLYDSGTELADTAGFAAGASNQVADKISEVTRGAASQAESVRQAASDTDYLGRDIDAVTDEINRMAGYSVEIRACLERATGTVDDLCGESRSIEAAIADLADVVRRTDEAVDSISGFSQRISGIASQTNLLSLNASIEASRAGAAGKGFAVVAEEIRQLADESRKCADEIKAVLERLSAGAGSSAGRVSVIGESVKGHTEKLEDTRSDMKLMADSVRHLDESADSAACAIEGLGERSVSLSGIIQDLSVISEQNQAFSEETTASMQELHSTFTIISESAEQLQMFADDLQETMSFFRV